MEQRLEHWYAISNNCHETIHSILDRMILFVNQGNLITRTLPVDIGYVAIHNLCVGDSPLLIEHAGLHKCFRVFAAHWALVIIEYSVIS